MSNLTPQELVNREVYYCVSSLISELQSVADQLDDYNTYLTLTSGEPDYEEAATQFVLNDTDTDDLETIAEQYSYWDDVVEAATDASRTLRRPFVVKYTTPDDDSDEFECWAVDSESACEACFSEIEGATVVSVKQDLHQDIESWCDKNPDLLDTLRNRVLAILENESDSDVWQLVCNDFDLDAEYGEIYEHWIVSDWLGRKLKARGHVVEEYLGLTIWGRGCTGQAIYMDNVIERICNEL